MDDIPITRREGLVVVKDTKMTRLKSIEVHRHGAAAKSIAWHKSEKEKIDLPSQ